MRCAGWHHGSLGLPLACALALTACGETNRANTGDVGDGTGGETGGETGGDGDGEGDEIAWPTLECDALVPEYCAFPYPNNVFSTVDPGTPTGRRLAMNAAMMPGEGTPPTTDTFNMSDGFSPSSTLMAFFPGGTTAGLPTPLTIPDSLGAGSPTVILNADTGERVPHWAEYDMSHGDDGRRAFMLRPAVRLEPNTRYIAAIRDVVDGDNQPLPASAAFAALRDESASDDADVEERRALYEDIFARLDTAGVPRDTLQLAWDFTTASDANITERALAVRDKGLAALPEGGPDFTVDNVTMNPAAGIAMRVEATITVPLFLDDPGAGGSLVYGDDGLPAQNGTAEYPVLIHVPISAYDTPARLMAYGHGMLGSRFEILAGHLQALCADRNVIVFATDWVGMAEDDVGNIISILTLGAVDNFHTVPDRLMQGFLNGFAAMRLMQGRITEDPAFDGVQIDTVDPWYFGGSQGGIFGSNYMALSPDVMRGVLAVPGQPYSLLLNRSVNFSSYFSLLDSTYPDKLDLRFMIELVQLEWDRAEPSGFSRHIVHDPLPGTPAKEVLLMASIGDHQVTTLGAHMMAREIGVPQIAPENRAIFGIETTMQPHTGSALIEYDWGLPPEPITNVPMSEGEDPHGKLAGSPEGTQTVEQFLRTGVVETFCDGPCDPG